MVDLPPTLLQEIDALVREGRFGSRDQAVAELIRLGLQALQGRGPMPMRPPPHVPPMGPQPGDDRPIQPDPRDINWAP